MVEQAKKRPTLRTIAQLTGLAVPTVSRALNDAPDIRAATKARVRDVARDIGYVPDRAGVRLRTGRTNVVALVLGTDNEVTDHTGQLVSSIATTLRDTRYHMIVTPYSPTEDPMAPVRYIAETASADAVILNRIELDDPRVTYLRDRKIPVVTYGRTQNFNEESYFDFDNTTFGQAAAENLLTAGRRNIVLLAPPMNQNYARHMAAGASEVLASHGLSLHIADGFTADDSGAEMRAGVTDLLLKRPDTDGLICPSTTSAISATVAVEESGRVLGQDIDFFAKEAIAFLRFFRSQIMTVTEDVKEAGSFLARAAIEAIEHPNRPPMQKLIAARRSTEN
ncbi:MAG: LacI family DNA-binding transcriptional regulator [Rhodobacteraceae bacterium]|nr:LacI family DNA-binding transcriptional regulator [Paracoccaceae bacterium]